MKDSDLEMPDFSKICCSFYFPFSSVQKFIPSWQGSMVFMCLCWNGYMMLIHQCILVLSCYERIIVHILPLCISPQDFFIKTSCRQRLVLLLILLSTHCLSLRLKAMKCKITTALRSIIMQKLVLAWKSSTKEVWTQMF